MAIREIHFAFELVEGTASASDYKVIPVRSFKPQNKNPREVPRETTGTTIVMHKTRRKGRHFEFTLEMYSYFDMLAYPLSIHLGYPVHAAVVGATGAFTQTFKPGGTAIPSATLRWKRVSSTNTTWFRATGCKIKSMKFLKQANGLPVVQFQGFGKYATTISAPTPVTPTAAQYIQPTDTPQQSLTKGGTNWLLLKKLDVATDNGMAPDWTIQPTQDPARLALGDAKADLSAQGFFDAYAGSLIEGQDGATGLLGQIIATINDTTSPIGTGTPTTPRIMFTAPKPFVMEADFTDSQKDDEEDGKIELGYDTTAVSNLLIELRNELAASEFVGH